MTESAKPIEPTIQPISLVRSTALFLGCGAVATAIFSGGTPWLVQRGVDPTGRLMIQGGLIFGFLLILSLALYAREGRKLEWRSLCERFRIRNISGRAWCLVLAGVLVVDLSYIGLQFTREPILAISPEWLKAPHRSDPDVDFSGQYLTLALFTGLILLNVISEEFLWRGYLLPRQELQHGGQTWWIHGIQWTLFHWFKPWDLIAILPGALVYGWLCTKTRSMVPGLVLHLGLNGLGIVLMAVQVFN